MGARITEKKAGIGAFSGKRRIKGMPMKHKGRYQNTLGRKHLNWYEVVLSIGWRFRSAV
jgi:hypothetical protein